MELLTPTPPPRLAGNHFSHGFYPPAISVSSLIARRDHHLQNHVATGVSGLSEFVGEAGDKIAVAVGKSFEKSLSLLNFCFQRFSCREVILLHVHQPSPTIPTLLGKLPASQANEEMVSAFRKEEIEQTRKLLLNYLNFCRKAQVKAGVITIEAAQVKNGIVDLVNKHSIRKLIMGAIPENCMKVKKTSSKANFAAKNVAPFCEIWFVNKRKHIWTREASEGLTIFPSVLNSPDTALSDRLSSSLPHSPVGEIIANNRSLQTDFLRTGVNCFEVRDQVHSEPDKMEVASSTSGSCFTNQFDSLTSERFYPPVCNSKIEVEILYNQLSEVTRLAETLKSEAIAERLKCKKLEAEAFEAINKVKELDAAHAYETKLLGEVEDMLRITRQQQQMVLEQREEVNRNLKNLVTNVAVLDIHCRRSACRQEQVTGELRSIQASLETLQNEREIIQQQKEEAMFQLELCRGGHTGVPSCDRFIQFFDESLEFTEFSLSDLLTATCDFSESFKIGEGGYGCVYKGEIFNRSVAIKKLHPFNMQCLSGFQQEVLVLSKLRHPNLVNLIGACSEAWSLVYEYMPNGSLQDHLFRKRNTPPLTWKIRTRIAAKISSALLFLHSTKPERIIHGNLKPENILLDACFNCKIGDFGICRLAPEESDDFPSFRSNTEPKSAYPYTDPELQRNGNLTPKSDVYSFGIIILQLLTGRPAMGITNEVRRAVFSGKLTSILDTSAGEWPTCLAERLVDVGLQCCELNSRDRPELTPTIVRELDQLHVPEEQPVPSFFLCPILREIMNDPHVAADGFTYEGEAIREWLEDGHDTSPMTNLKLSHLHLTPNHVLRQAIQDWLWQS